MKIVLATLCLFAFAGCAAETGYPSDEKSDQIATNPAMNGPDSDEHGTPYTVTEVGVGADGREEVTVHPRTKHLDTAAPGGLHTKSMVVPTYCDESSVRLYDKSLSECAALGCNEICFRVQNDYWQRGSSASVVSLGKHCVTRECKDSWNSKVRSYWSGNRAMALTRNYAESSWKCSDPEFRRWTYANALVCGQNSNQLAIQY